jgi:hypothetical protein
MSLTVMGRRRVAIPAALAVLVAGVSLTWVATADAGPNGSGFGYVWADSPTFPVGQPYEPAHQYQRNSSGVRNTITHTGTGAYSVFFPNLGAFGTPAVTAYAGTDERCRVASWRATVSAGRSGTAVAVRCFTRTGTPVDTMFSATYAQAAPGTTTVGAYLWSHKASPPLNRPYTPDTRHLFSSAGSGATVTRIETGRYEVKIRGRQVGFGLVVTATGTSSAYCSGNEIFSESNQTRVFVGCTNAAGAAADSAFAMSIIGSGNTMFASTVAAEYALDVCYGDVPGDPSISRTCQGTPADWLDNGLFAVHLPINMSNGNVQITQQNADAFNPTWGRCKVVSWSGDTVMVRCYDIWGAPAGFSHFRVAFVA